MRWCKNYILFYLKDVTFEFTNSYDEMNNKELFWMNSNGLYASFLQTKNVKILDPLKNIQSTSIACLTKVLK